MKKKIQDIILFLKKEAKEAQWLSDDQDYNAGVESGLWIAIDKLEGLERDMDE